jgi:hypothetical protein
MLVYITQLSWVFKKWVYGLDRAGSGQGRVAGTCDCGNESSGWIKCGEFLDQLKPVSFLRRTLLHGVSK